MRCSVVIPTYNKGYALQRVLESVRMQKPGFDYEIIVVDDGSSDDTASICKHYAVEYEYLDRPYICGPAKAKNIGYRRAHGEIILCLNDDVMMTSPDDMRVLCDLPRKAYRAARTRGLSKDGELGEFMSNQHPLFFFTAVPRKHLYAVGGCDERFTMLNYEDAFLKDCLVFGRGLSAGFTEGPVGHHIWHERPDEHWAGARFEQAKLLYSQMVEHAYHTGVWCAS